MTFGLSIEKYGATPNHWPDQMLISSGFVNRNATDIEAECAKELRLSRAANSGVVCLWSRNQRESHRKSIGSHQFDGITGTDEKCRLRIPRMIRSISP